MNIYPQLTNGAVCQFPLEKILRYRTIVNPMEDGSRIVLQDLNATALQWNLNYAGLTDTEAGALQAFFDSVQGRLQSFTFLDPTGNLLAWSEDCSQTVWQKSTFLESQAGVANPLGTQRATTITNSGSGDLGLVQSISVPDSYLCCLSFFVRSTNTAAVTLTRGAVSKTAAVSNGWQQVYLASRGSDGNATSNFGVTIAAGGRIDLFGMQVNAQPKPATYVQTLDRSGVYPATRFDSDSLAFTADAPDSNSCRISLYSRVSP